MEVLQALINLTKDVKEIKSNINKINKSDAEKFKENWLDAQDVMLALHISPRTLQRYRDDKILPYSHIKGKIFYKLSDIIKLLENNYSK